MPRYNTGISQQCNNKRTGHTLDMMPVFYFAEENSIFYSENTANSLS
jgi:hypothetical protein